MKMISLEEEQSNVIRDGNGVPEEWTLLRIGENELVKDGESGSLKLTRDDMDKILGYQAEKGEEIPIDSNHYLYELANRKELDETEVLKLIPSGVAAMGYGTLSLSGEELRIHVKWNPTAYELLKEKIFQYYSPVVRGLQTGRLRVTSVALENEPAMNHLNSLSATSRGRDEGLGFQNGLEESLSHLLNVDQAALTAKGCDGIQTLSEKIESKAELLKGIRESLCLGAEVTDEELLSAIHGLIVRTNLTESLQKELSEQREELETLRLNAETETKERLIRQGLREGKLSRSLAETWARDQDSAALAEYLHHAPVIIPVYEAKTCNGAGHQPEVKIELTETDREVIERFGYDETEYSAMKKQLRKRGVC